MFLCILVTTGSKLHIIQPLGPFQVAATFGSIETLETLYEVSRSEADMERELDLPSALWLACTVPDNLEKIQLLFDRGFDVQCVRPTGPCEDLTPLHLAAQTGDLGEIEFL